MRTLVLAEEAFRDLRSRALLEGIAARFACEGPILVTAPRGDCPPGFHAVPVMPDTSGLGVGRVVIAGVFQDRIQLERALYVTQRAVKGGAVLETHCLTIAGDAARREAPAGVAVLESARVLEVRDHGTADAVAVWRVAAMIRIAAFAERDLATDGSLAAKLPDEAILGIGILGGGDVMRDIAQYNGALRALLEPAAGWAVLPLPAEAPGTPRDDFLGTSHFIDALLPQARRLLPSPTDPARHFAALAPGRFKGLVARCRLVVTNQDVVAAFAVAAGVPVLGVKLGGDRRIVTCIAALANELPTGSELVFADRYRRPPA